MRAVVYDRYGPPAVLHLEEVAPPIPEDDELLVRIRATTVNRTDCALRGGADLVTRLGYSIVTTGSPFKALRRPQRRILGSELAGEVVAVGPAVRAFAVGDRVFGLNPGRFGAHAELVCLRATAPVATMPAGLPFDEAAAIPDGALTALGCLRHADLQPGQRILIYGASGSIGTAAVQLAKSFGASVTAVCRPKNGELARALGADGVIDYTRTDFTQNGETYEVIFDAVGKLSFWRCRGSLTAGGTFLPTDGWPNLVLALGTTRLRTKRVALTIPPHFRQPDLVFLTELIAAGHYRAVIDRRYPLEQIVAATQYVETGHKAGNVVLTV